jgi:hypothetical protein
LLFERSQWLQDLSNTANIVEEWVAALVSLGVPPAVIVEEFSRRMERAFRLNVNIERQVRALETYHCRQQVIPPVLLQRNFTNFTFPGKFLDVLSQTLLAL